MFPPGAPIKQASVYHLPTTAGSKQPYPGSADETVTLALLPMDAKQHLLEGGDYVNPHEAYAPASADIRVGDNIVIESVSYYVKHIFKANFGGLRHQRVSLSTER